MEKKRKMKTTPGTWWQYSVHIYGKVKWEEGREDSARRRSLECVNSKAVQNKRKVYQMSLQC